MSDIWPDLCVAVESRYWSLVRSGWNFLLEYFLLSSPLPHQSLCKKKKKLNVLCRPNFFFPASAFLVCVSEGRDPHFPFPFASYGLPNSLSPLFCHWTRFRLCNAVFVSSSYIHHFVSAESNLDFFGHFQNPFYSFCKCNLFITYKNYNFWLAARTFRISIYGQVAMAISLDRNWGQRICELLLYSFLVWTCTVR